MKMSHEFANIYRKADWLANRLIKFKAKNQLIKHVYISSVTGGFNCLTETNSHSV